MWTSDGLNCYYTGSVLQTGKQSQGETLAECLTGAWLGFRSSATGFRVVPFPRSQDGKSQESICM